MGRVMCAGSWIASRDGLSLKEIPPGETQERNHSELLEKAPDQHLELEWTKPIWYRHQQQDIVSEKGRQRAQHGTRIIEVLQDLRTHHIERAE